ncbi:MAG TPA: DUF6489 family protein [Verrucomicrobiae bacterium]|nr:DUF6489 family protein [Verrucomicrobiae bacterium]
MKVKVEIDMKPEELQRFLGMPDVAAMREEVLRFIKERIAADPAGFVMDNLDSLRKSRPLRRFLYGNQARPEGRDED